MQDSECTCCRYAGGTPLSAAGFGTQVLGAETTNKFRVHSITNTKIAVPEEAHGEVQGCDDEDLELIEQLLQLALEAIDRKAPDVRLADILKLLEFKQRIKPQADVRAMFWEWIERFRRDAARQIDQEKTVGGPHQSIPDKEEQQ